MMGEIRKANRDKVHRVAIGAGNRLKPTHPAIRNRPHYFLHHHLTINNNEMKVSIEQWEIERVKEKVGRILDFTQYDFIETNDGHGRSLGMSIEEFLKQLDRELKN